MAGSDVEEGAPVGYALRTKVKRWRIPRLAGLFTPDSASSIRATTDALRIERNLTAESFCVAPHRAAQVTDSVS